MHTLIIRDVELHQIHPVWVEARVEARARLLSALEASGAQKDMRVLVFRKYPLAQGKSLALVGALLRV